MATLCEAIREKNLDELVTRITAGCDVNKETEEGNTLLTFACNVYKRSEFEYTGRSRRGTTSNHFNGDRHDPFGFTATADTVYINSDDICRDIDIKQEEDILKALVENGCPVSHTDAKGWSPLHYTTHSHNAHLTATLLSLGAEINTPSSKAYNNVAKGSTPLHVAVHIGSLCLTELLISRNSDCNIYNNDGFTPLLAAVDCSKDDLVTAIANSTNININSTFKPKSVTSQCILHTALTKCAFGTIEILIKEGASVNCKCLDSTPILHSLIPLIPNVGEKKISLVKCLLEHGYDANVQDSADSNTCLHLLPRYLIKWKRLAKEQLEIGKLLCDHQQSDLNLLNKQSETVLISAMKVYIENRLHFVNVKKFINHLLEKDCINLYFRDRSDKTVFDLVFEKFYLNYDLITALLDKGYDINCTDASGRTALHSFLLNPKTRLSYECRPRISSPKYTANTQLRLFDQLVKYGARFDVVDKFGTSLLLICIWRGFYIIPRTVVNQCCHQNVVQLKLPSKDVNCHHETVDECVKYFLPRYHSMTPLQVMIIQNSINLKFLPVFLQAGADVHVECNESYKHMSVLQLYNQNIHIASKNGGGQFTQTACIAGCHIFENLIFLLSAGALYQKGMHLCLACEDEDTSTYHRYMLAAWEANCLRRNNEKLQKLVELGYQFQPKDQILDDEHSDCISDSITLFPSLEILAVRSVRCNLYPNAWVSAKCVPLPALLYDRHFGKYID